MANNFFKISQGLTLKGLAADPSNPTNGDLYYNTTLNRFRVYEAGAWTTLVGDTTTDILSNKTLQTLVGAVVTDATTTGSAATLQAGDIASVIVRLTNASLVSVSGIPAGASGQVLIVENVTGTTALVLDNDTGATAANRIRTGTGAPVQMPTNSTFIFTYDATAARWMLTGGSGSGSGSGNTILETLKNEFIDSPYQLLSTNIISTDVATKFATLTGATSDLANKTISFSANAQTATSTNMLDVNEFYPQSLDIGSIDLSVFWNRGTLTTAYAIPTAFTYNVSRDGGVNYFPVTMSRVGTTEVFYGSLQFGTSTTTEASPTALQTITGGSQTNQDLNTTTQQSIAQTFTVPANTNWVINQTTLNFVKTGSPTGNIFVSIQNSSSNLPTTTVLAQSNAITAASITTGALAVALPSTVLTGGTSGTTYEIVVSTDATYKSIFNAGTTKLQLVQTTASTGEAVYNGTTWSTVSGQALLGIVAGRTQDLRVQIVSAGSPTYPCGLDGFGVFYNLQNLGIVGATKKTQKFIFNSVTDNLSTFTITNFSPDPDLLSCYWVEGGQVFKAPAFQLQGNVVSFPTGSFNQAGVSQTITLVFDQNSGGAFDNSDSNAQLLAANHLGSSSASIDRSLAGRGILLRDQLGTLKEVAIGAIPGRVDGVAVSAGYIGQYQELPRTSSITLTSATLGDLDPGCTTWSDANATGLTLTPGIYDIQGVAFVTVPGSSFSRIDLGIGTAKQTSSVGTDTLRNYFSVSYQSGVVPVSGPIVSTPVWRVNISVTTTYYLKLYAVFSGTASTATGNIAARRIA